VDTEDDESFQRLAIPHLNLDIRPSAEPLLSDRSRIILDGVLRVIRRESAHRGLSTSRVVVTGHVSPEDDDAQLVVTQWVSVPASAAFDYWDDLAAAVDHWARTLPAAERQIAREDVAVAVRWDSDAGDVIARDWTGVTDRRDVHRRVLQELGKRNQQGIGSQLNDLRVLREVADYQRQPYEPDHQDWQHNWQVASAIAMRILSRYERLRIIPRVTI
jgi:hypothetical protein